jgi:hypothetical protein
MITAISCHFNLSLIIFQALLPLLFAFNRPQSPSIIVFEAHSKNVTHLPPFSLPLASFAQPSPGVPSLSETASEPSRMRFPGPRL